MVEVAKNAPSKCSSPHLLLEGVMELSFLVSLVRRLQSLQLILHPDDEEHTSWVCLGMLGYVSVHSQHQGGIKCHVVFR